MAARAAGPPSTHSPLLEADKGMHKIMRKGMKQTAAGSCNYNVREQLRDTSDVRICVNNDRIPVHVTIESCACPFLQDGGGSRPELRDGVLDAL